MKGAGAGAGAGVRLGRWRHTGPVDREGDRLACQPGWGMDTPTVILAEVGAGGSRQERAAWGLHGAEAVARTDECVMVSRQAEVSDGHAFLQGKEARVRHHARRWRGE